MSSAAGTCTEHRPSEPNIGRASRFIAFFLPQFHPIPENDRWWGKGFTEWANVTTAKPLFCGHYQPHLPADSGFYDLRVPETRMAQAEMAERYGLEGFCYYHYWFHGKRLLHRPIDELLATGQPKFPFCLCWANESWTRRWLGDEKDVLMHQSYSSEDDLAHSRWLTNVFADPRYMTWYGRPIFLIYRPADLPEPERSLDVLRDECQKHGVNNPYLIGVDAHSATDSRQMGFDATLNFQPQLGVLPGFLNDRAHFSKLRRNLEMGIFSASLKVYDDGWARQRMKALPKKYPHYPCVFVGWDNTPRRHRQAIVIRNSGPERFAGSLRETLETVLKKPAEERLVFINAWNEWAEGNHLEPDQHFGRGYLEVVRNSVSDMERRSDNTSGTVFSVSPP